LTLLQLTDFLFLLSLDVETKKIEKDGYYYAKNLIESNNGIG